MNCCWCGSGGCEGHDVALIKSLARPRVEGRIGRVYDLNFNHPWTGDEETVIAQLTGLRHREIERRAAYLGLAIGRTAAAVIRHCYATNIVQRRSRT